MTHNVPQVYDGIQVWEVTSSVDSISVFIVKELQTHSSHTGPVITIRQITQGPLEKNMVQQRGSEICYWQFLQKHAYKWQAGGHFIGLWHFACSSLQKGADSRHAAGPMPCYCPLEHSWCTGAFLVMGDKTDLLATLEEQHYLSKLSDCRHHLMLLLVKHEHARRMKV